MRRGHAGRLVASMFAALAVSLTWSPAASAIVAYNSNGHFWSVAPRQGIAPASIPGSLASRRGQSPQSTNGNLDYQGGSVLHSSEPYLIFWDPTGSGISAASRGLLERYFTDVAADSGHATNVYAVDRQFTDGSGFADYRQTFSSSTQAIADTHAYPARDTSNCARVASTYLNCLTDLQLTTELKRLIAADGLPTGTGTNAPIYFIVTPGNVNVCTSKSKCADNTFCAYHSFATSGPVTMLYASIPLFFDGASSAQNPKNCQADGTSAIQKPNRDLADVAIKYMSHEDNETITDPVGKGWYDSNSGNEDGDNCNFTGSFDPQGGTNPNAFLPTLGGSSSAGTLYDQLIDGNPYYIQSEWSNGDVNCEMQPSPGTVSPSFTAPSGSVAQGTSAAFDPSASSSAAGYSSATWSFGDGSAPVFRTAAPTSANHTFGTPGLYSVSLTLVDTHGNLATSTHGVQVGSSPTATFTLPGGAAPVGVPVSFNAAGSSDSNGGGSIGSYAWDFGDGKSGSGTTPSHAYAKPGTYTVTLTVTDNYGLTSLVTHQVVVVAPPTAAFTSQSPTGRVGAAIGFSAAGSSDPNSGGSISSYAWDFGDGKSGSGTTPSHAYAKPGTYTVSLTVTDNYGLTSQSISHQIKVLTPPSADFIVRTGHPAAGVSLRFDAAPSTDPSGLILDYAWRFGDSSTGSGATATHAYSRPGSYTVTLTITDNSGQTASVTAPVVVAAAEKITEISLARTRRGAALLIKLDGPGTLYIGSHRFRIKRARTVSFKLALSGSQRRALRLGRRVRLQLAIRFVPVTGSAIARSTTITLRS
jgi:PKD repeat protein